MPTCHGTPASHYVGIVCIIHHIVDGGVLLIAGVRQARSPASLLELCKLGERALGLALALGAPPAPGGVCHVRHSPTSSQSLCLSRPAVHAFGKPEASQVWLQGEPLLTCPIHSGYVYRVMAVHGVIQRALLVHM